MQDVLEFIVKNLTTSPDDVNISAQEEHGITHFTISAHPDDIGRIIGKEGKVIKAIRTIMRVMAIQRNVRVRISVLSDQPTTTTEQVNSKIDDEVIVEGDSEADLSVEI